MGWLRFFLDGVQQIAREAVDQAGRLLNLRERWLRRLAGPRWAQPLVDALLVNPYMSAARAQAVLRVSNPTARQAVARLEQTCGGIARTDFEGAVWCELDSGGVRRVDWRRRDAALEDPAPGLARPPRPHPEP